jgi:hypothetical protein
MKFGIGFICLFDSHVYGVQNEENDFDFYAVLPNVFSIK